MRDGCDETGEGVWWCNSHGRPATHINNHGDHCCDPKLGGILIPCRAILAPIKLTAAILDEIHDELSRSAAQPQCDYNGTPIYVIYRVDQNEKVSSNESRSGSE